MVVDGAPRFARQAEQALSSRNYEAAHSALITSREFVAELIGGLNPQSAREVVDRMQMLSAVVYRNLAQADLLHDPELAAGAIRVLQTHRETWLELIRQLQDGHSVAAEPTTSAVSENLSRDETTGPYSNDWQTD